MSFNADIEKNLKKGKINKRGKPNCTISFLGGCHKNSKREAQFLPRGSLSAYGRNQGTRT